MRRAGGALGEAPQHNHEPEIWIPDRNRLYSECKRRSIAETTSLATIYQEEAARFADGAVHLPYDRILPSMRKWRRSVQPPIPGTLAEYGAALANRPDYGQLHLATVSAGGASAVILGMPGFAECLHASSTVIADGTFKTVPSGPAAAQILTIHAVCNGQYYHPITVIMENRQRVLYTAVLQTVWRLANNPRPASVVTDYEPALQAALQEVTGIQTSGCYFHYLQALYRRARRDGIGVSRNSVGSRLVRLYGALALLPPERVPAALAELPRAARSDGLPFSQRFHDYFHDYWMVNIGPECFSVHGRPHRTSNVAESYHAALARSLGPAPNIWRFTQLMAERFNYCATRRRGQLAGNAPPVRRNRERQSVRATTVANNLAALDRGTITLGEFLSTTSRSIEAGAGVIVHDVPDVDHEVEIVEAEAEEEERPPAVVDDARDVPEVAVAAAPAPAPAAPVPRPCGVCMDAMPTRVLIPCGHVLCDACVIGIERIAEVYNRQCPFCRTHINNVYQLYL